ITWQRWGMGNLVNRRTGVIQAATIARAGSAQVGGDRHSADRFEPIPVKTEQGFGPAMEPAGLKPKRGCLPGAESIRVQGDLTGIGAGPNPAGAADVE